MNWYWSYESLPELANLPMADQLRIRRAARRRMPFCYQQWLAGIGVAIAGEIFESFLRRSAPEVLSEFRRVLSIGIPVGALLVFRHVGLWFARPYLAMELPGHCRACGFDLTGNMSGLCPECGSSVTTERPLQKVWLRISAGSFFMVFLSVLVVCSSVLMAACIAYVILR